MNSKNIVFPCGDIKLEGKMYLPESKWPFPAVVVCHPHPLYGGDMHSSVISAICVALAGNSIAALKFNFRGVGDSGGAYNEGVAEQDDVKAAIDYLSKLPEIDNKRIGLAGYSFGGMVALPVALGDKRVKQLALISPALKETDWVQLKEYSLPKLILVGDADTSVPFRPFQHLFGDKKQYQVIDVADHFWLGFEEEIGGRVVRFFSFGLQVK